MQGAGDHVDLARDLAGVVARQLEAEPLLHRLFGDALRLGRRARSRSSSVSVRRVEVGAGREAVGRQVVQLVVVALDADIGGAGRVERRPLIDVAVGEVIDSSHAYDPTERVRRLSVGQRVGRSRDRSG